MGFRPETRADLREELMRLDEQVTVLQRRMEVIQELLDLDDDAPSPQGGASSANGATGDLSGMKFREAMFTVLREIPNAKPAQVTSSMQHRGYKDNAKTKLATRVRNDLWKLADAGKLVRNKRGEYRLPDEAT